MKNVRAEQAAKADARKKAAEGKRDLYRQLFTSDVGLEVLKDMALFVKHGEDIFAMSQDERTNAYNQGRQSVLIHIKKILED